MFVQGSLATIRINPGDTVEAATKKLDAASKRKEHLRSLMKQRKEGAS